MYIENFNFVTEEAVLGFSPSVGSLTESTISAELSI